MPPLLEFLLNLTNRQRMRFPLLIALIEPDYLPLLVEQNPARIPWNEEGRLKLDQIRGDGRHRGGVHRSVPGLGIPVAHETNSVAAV